MLLWISAACAIMPAMPAARLRLNPEDLRDGNVHIWPVRLAASDPVLEWFRGLLSDPELARAESFRFERLRRLFALSRGALRVLLSRYLRCLPEEISFVYGEKGKPTLANNSSKLHFNTSHSGDIALFGFAMDLEIGVDVEQFRSMDDMPVIAARCFSAPEISDLESLPPDERVEAFFRCWTRKEAYIKATGNGLSSPLDSFRVTLLPGQPPRLTELFPAGRMARAWNLANLEIAEGYAAALAYQGEERGLEAHELVDAERLPTVLAGPKK